MGILSPSKILTKHGDKMIFKNPILSPSKLYDNGDLVPIRNIYQAWGQDNFQSLYLVPIQKTSQWGSCPHQIYLIGMGTRQFLKSLSCPHSKNITMGILSPSEIFTRHGDKIIFKVSILSTFKKHLNGDLVPITNIYQAWGQDNFQILYLVPIQKTSQWRSCPHQKYLQSMRTRQFLDFLSCPHLKNMSIFTKHRDKIIFKISILSPFK